MLAPTRELTLPRGFQAETSMLPSVMLVLAAQHDPEVYCTACIRLVANLQDAQGLVPMLRSAVTLAKTTKPELGALDALAEEYVIERGCKWYATWNNLTIRKACLHITEEHGESLVEKITRWATKERLPTCVDMCMSCTVCSRAVHTWGAGPLAPEGHLCTCSVRVRASACHGPVRACHGPGMPCRAHRSGQRAARRAV